jgi:hypothetical protein
MLTYTLLGAALLVAVVSLEPMRYKDRQPTEAASIARVFDHGLNFVRHRKSWRC